MPLGDAGNISNTTTNGLSGSFLLTCGGIESVACTKKKLSGVDRSAQTRQLHIKSPRIHLHTPPNPTCSR